MGSEAAGREELAGCDQMDPTTTKLRANLKATPTAALPRTPPPGGTRGGGGEQRCERGLRRTRSFVV